MMWLAVEYAQYQKVDISLVNVTNNNNKYSMTDKVKIIPMGEQHLDETAELLVRSFMNLNNIWKQYDQKYETVFPIVRAKILPGLNSQWSHIMIKNHKVIGCCINCDILDYLDTPSMPHKLELFNKLGKAGKDLESQLDLTGVKRGDICYGPYAMIDPNEGSKGYSLKFWWQCFAYAVVSGGWKSYYSRISSEVSLKMLLKLGAEILAETSIEVEGREPQRMWMIKIDLRKPFPTYSMLEAMCKQPKPRASL